MPRSRTPAEPPAPGHLGAAMMPAALVTASAVRDVYEFRGSITRPARLPVYASQTASPLPTQHSVPAGWPTLAGQDSHLRRRKEGFRHVTTCLPPSPSFAWRKTSVAPTRIETGDHKGRPYSPVPNQPRGDPVPCKDTNGSDTACASASRARYVSFDTTPNSLARRRAFAPIVDFERAEDVPDVVPHARRTEPERSPDFRVPRVQALENLAFARAEPRKTRAGPLSNLAQQRACLNRSLRCRIEPVATSAAIR